ncbi:MAG: hypothetical protein J6C53_04210 [Clostridia bacterium]|nr:hypothetical protein [Clostridia bacterium]
MLFLEKEKQAKDFYMFFFNVRKEPKDAGGCDSPGAPQTLFVRFRFKTSLYERGGKAYALKEGEFDHIKPPASPREVPHRGGRCQAFPETGEGARRAEEAHGGTDKVEN